MGHDLVHTKVSEKDSENESARKIRHDESNISKYYAGKTIFITGSTGFIGKQIVEKVLRSCPEVKRIYLLVRPKRETEVADRLKKYFHDALFKTVLDSNPTIIEKVKAIEGNMMLPDLGLSPEDRHTLTTETDLIIHSAAVTNFFAKISMILKVNILGVKALLDLASDCKQLNTFLLVSTAYSQSYMQSLDDKTYPMVVNLNTIYDMIKADTDNESGLSKEAVNAVVGHWPNVYVFTKAFGEELLTEYSRRSNFHCCIFRPSIVMCSWKEPVPGWLKTKGGYAMSLIANGLGLIRSVHIANPAAVTDIIPVDLTVNNMLAIPWYTSVHRKETKGEPVVFNCGSSTCNPTTVHSCVYGVTRYIHDNPSSKALWYSGVYITKYLTIFNMMVMFFHILPSMVVDLVLIIQRKKPYVTPMVRSFVDSVIAVLYFPNGNFRIHIPNLKKLWETLNDTDRELFPCDLRDIDWETYYRISWEGAKEHLLVEPVQASAETKRRYFWLKVLHYTVLFFLVALVAMFFYKLAYYTLSIF